MDETVDIIIKIKNSGNIKAVNLSLNDSIPGCAAFVSGERSLSGELGSGESWASHQNLPGNRISSSKRE